MQKLLVLFMFLSMTMAQTCKLPSSYEKLYKRAFNDEAHDKKQNLVFLSFMCKEGEILTSTVSGKMTRVLNSTCHDGKWEPNFSNYTCKGTRTWRIILFHKLLILGIQQYDVQGPRTHTATRQSGRKWKRRYVVLKSTMKLYSRPSVGTKSANRKPSRVSKSPTLKRDSTEVVPLVKDSVKVSLILCEGVCLEILSRAED